MKESVFLPEWDKLNKPEQKREETTECVRTGRTGYQFTVGEESKEKVELILFVRKMNIGIILKYSVSVSLTSLTQ